MPSLVQLPKAISAISRGNTQCTLPRCGSLGGFPNGDLLEAISSSRRRSSAEGLVGEACSHPAAVAEFPGLLIVAQQERPQPCAAASGISPPADHEFLPLHALELEPACRPSLLISPVHSFGHESLDGAPASMGEDERTGAPEMIAVADGRWGAACLDQSFQDGLAIRQSPRSGRNPRIDQVERIVDGISVLPRFKRFCRA